MHISDWSSDVCSSDLSPSCSHCGCGQTLHSPKSKNESLPAFASAGQLDQNLVGGRDSVWSRFVQLIAQTQRACPIRISLRLAAGNLGPDGPPVFRRNAANFSRICPPIILTFERRDLWGKVIA